MLSFFGMTNKNIWAFLGSVYHPLLGNSRCWRTISIDEFIMCIKEYLFYLDVEQHFHLCHQTNSQIYPWCSLTSSSHKTSSYYEKNIGYRGSIKVFWIFWFSFGGWFWFPMIISFHLSMNYEQSSTVWSDSLQYEHVDVGLVQSLEKCPTCTQL